MSSLTQTLGAKEGQGKYICVRLTNLALGGASAGQEGLDLRAILLEVVVVHILDSVHVENWRLMEVMGE